jgi:hypothetical protein
MKRAFIKLRMFRSNPDHLDLFLEDNSELSTENFFRISEPVKLHGNFQSWAIVEKAAEYGFPRLLQLQKIPNWIGLLDSEIDFKDSLVLHFRVGDDTRLNSNFRQPEFAYYLSALELLLSQRDFSGVYILSDDISRVQEMFGTNFPEEFNYLEMPPESSPAERLYVLSLFGGIICANSTFCGWAAWSIYNSGGEVVVPVPYSDGWVLGSRDFPAKWHKLSKSTGEVVF